MSSQIINSLSQRVSKASEILKVEEAVIFDCLRDIGIEDESCIELLQAATTTEKDLVEAMEEAFGDKTKKLQRKAAAAVLKGTDPFSKEPIESSYHKEKVATTSTSDLSKVILAINENRPIEQLKDRELLEIFDKERDEKAELELDRRAKGQRFIVLKTNNEFSGIGTEPIDIELSLQLLKKTRKMKIPTMIPGEDSKIVPVYKIGDLDLQERLVEICPICGELLFRGYCETCKINFSDISEESRQYMKIVVDEHGINTGSYADRKSLFADALKGLSYLRQTWPSYEPKYRELKLSGNLPRIKMIKNLPSEQVADPFYVAGNRKF